MRCIILTMAMFPLALQAQGTTAPAACPAGMVWDADQNVCVTPAAPEGLEDRGGCRRPLPVPELSA